MKGLLLLFIVGLSVMGQGCAATPFLSSIPGAVTNMFDPGHTIASRNSRDPEVAGQDDEPPGLIKSGDSADNTESGGTGNVQEEKNDPPQAESRTRVKTTSNTHQPTAARQKQRDEDFYRRQDLAMSNGLAITPHQVDEPIPRDGTIPIKLGTISAVSDVKAHQIGDIVTVVISEAINGQTQANTNISSARTTKSGLPGFFGATAALAAHNPFLDTQNLVNSSYNHSTQGGGAMTASDTFTANVSAVVVGLTPSGNLYIKGDRRVLIHGEYDVIHLTGIVRPQDLDSNNTVPSNLVANLHLTFSGTGQVHDQQRAGVGSRVLDWLWPF